MLDPALGNVRRQANLLLTSLLNSEKLLSVLNQQSNVVLHPSCQQSFVLIHHKSISSESILLAFILLDTLSTFGLLLLLSSSS